LARIPTKSVSKAGLAEMISTLLKPKHIPDFGQRKTGIRHWAQIHCVQGVNHLSLVIYATRSAEPTNLFALKARMLERWPMTSLLDVFKEADLRIRFTDAFRSATAWENMDRAIIQERLLLALAGLGSNAGIKRMSAGQQRTN
jgi:hypothetical protein